MTNLPAQSTQWQLLCNNQKSISTVFLGRSRLRRNRRTSLSNIARLRKAALNTSHWRQGVKLVVFTKRFHSNYYCHYCHYYYHQYLSFWILSLIEFCHNLNFLFCHNLSFFFILLQLFFFSFVKIWVVRQN